MIGCFAQDYGLVDLKIPSVDEIETVSAERKSHKELRSLSGSGHHKVAM